MMKYVSADSVRNCACSVTHVAQKLSAPPVPTELSAHAQQDLLEIQLLNAERVSTTFLRGQFAHTQTPMSRLTHIEPIYAHTTNGEAHIEL